MTQFIQTNALKIRFLTSTLSIFSNKKYDIFFLLKCSFSNEMLILIQSVELDWVDVFWDKLYDGNCISYEFVWCTWESFWIESELKIKPHIYFNVSTFQLEINSKIYSNTHLNFRRKSKKKKISSNIEHNRNGMIFWWKCKRSRKKKSRKMFTRSYSVLRASQWMSPFVRCNIQIFFHLMNQNKSKKWKCERRKTRKWFLCVWCHNTRTKHS